MIRQEVAAISSYSHQRWMLLLSHMSTNIYVLENIDTLIYQDLSFQDTVLISYSTVPIFRFVSVSICTVLIEQSNIHGVGACFSPAIPICHSDDTLQQS